MLVPLALAAAYIVSAKIVKHIYNDGQKNGWVRW